MMFNLKTISKARNVLNEQAIKAMFPRSEKKDSRLESKTPNRVFSLKSSFSGGQRRRSYMLSAQIM